MFDDVFHPRGGILEFDAEGSERRREEEVVPYALTEREGADGGRDYDREVTKMLDLECLEVRREMVDFL